MKDAILTGVVILLAAAAVVKAEPPAKEAGIVSWQYFAGEAAIGDPVRPAGTKANLRCSVIASDEEGDWVCLHVGAVSQSALPEGMNADACRPLGKDGKPFKLTNPALWPDSDTAQAVVFASGDVETTYKLMVKKDGTISFEIVGPTFTGDTSMSGAASMCWYVSKKE
jgi:hypothetical protein